MRAGITKDITFHCARHTFAVLQLTLGTEIFTLSKLLGHSELKTTQIYAKLTRQKVNEDVKKVSDRIGRKYKLPVQSGSKAKKNNAK